MDQIDLQGVATLRSSDGWNSVTMGFARALRRQGEELVLARVAAVGRFWEREKSLDDAGLTDDYHVDLPQVLIAGSKLRECVQLLEVWLRVGSDVSLDISGEKGQNVLLSIGDRSDLICSEDHPAFTLRYSTARIETEFYFITDQSCIRIFLGGLKEWLRFLPFSIA